MGIAIFVDYQTLVRENIRYKRPMPTDTAVAICKTADWNSKSVRADMVTRTPKSRVGTMGMLSDGGASVSGLTASGLSCKLKEDWKGRKK